MAYEANIISFIGNLTADPDLRFTGGGAPVASFRVASNRKWTDKGGQQQEDVTYMNVNCWRDLAENAAESLNKGDRVIAIGRLKVRSYDNKEGVTVWVTEIEADEVAPSLRWARAQINRQSGNGGGQQQAPPASAPVPSDDDVLF